MHLTASIEPNSEAAVAAMSLRTAVRVLGMNSRERLL
jgi:hypothetical protein